MKIHLGFVNGVPRFAALTKQAAETNLMWLRDKTDQHTVMWLTTVELDTSLFVEMAKEPTNEAEALPMRRERNGGFSVSANSSDTSDYGANVVSLANAVSHLEESIPNGQLLRTRFAIHRLVNATCRLITWLEERKVL